MTDNTNDRNKRTDGGSMKTSEGGKMGADRTHDLVEEGKRSEGTSHSSGSSSSGGSGSSSGRSGGQSRNQ